MSGATAGAALSGRAYRVFLTSAAARLAAGQEELNAINIFPAPDGDTGDNLLATMRSAAQAAERVPGGALGALAEAAANGALRGARGNSGLILSQILWGFAEAFRKLDEAPVGEVARAFRRACDLAYASVAHPVEGTILTVIRECASIAQALASREIGLERLFAGIVEAANRAVDSSPDLLPALRRAGVVDAGAQGLADVLEAMWEAVADHSVPPRRRYGLLDPADIPAAPRCAFDMEVTLAAAQPQKVAAALAGRAESLVVTAGEGVTKLHLHTDDPVGTLGLCAAYGALLEARVQDMRRQREDRLSRHRGPAPVRALAAPTVDGTLPVIACADGQGFAALFRSLGVAEVLDAGEATAERLVSAVRTTGAERVILLPNSPACLPACERLSARSAGAVAVVPTTTQPQGVAALLAWRPEAGLDENTKAMTGSAAWVRTGVVVEVGDALQGLIDGKPVIAAASLAEAVRALVGHLSDQGRDVITLYAGSGVALADVQAIADELRKTTDATVEAAAGGQRDALVVVSAE